MIKLKEDYEPIVVTSDKPFSRVVGYAADLVYPRASSRCNNKRTNDRKLEDDPEVYKIVAITRNEVVLSADSNKRRTVIKYHASSAPDPAK